MKIGIFGRHNYTLYISLYSARKNPSLLQRKGKWAALFAAVSLSSLTVPHKSPQHSFRPHTLRRSLYQKRQGIRSAQLKRTCLQHYKKIHSKLGWHNSDISLSSTHFKNYQIWYRILKNWTWEDMLQRKWHCQLLLLKLGKSSGLLFSLIICSLRLKK